MFDDHQAFRRERKGDEMRACSQGSHDLSYSVALRKEQWAVFAKLTRLKMGVKKSNAVGMLPLVNDSVAASPAVQLSRQ